MATDDFIATKMSQAETLSTDYFASNSQTIEQLKLDLYNMRPPKRKVLQIKATPLDFCQQQVIHAIYVNKCTNRQVADRLSKHFDFDIHPLTVNACYRYWGTIGMYPVPVFG
jgi:hypothetical protein